MKGFVLLIVFLLFVSVVHAEFDQNKALSWLDSSKQCSRESTSIEEIVFTTIALDSSECLNKLKNNRMDDSGCFPKGDCNTKDTALGILALSAKNQNVEDQLEYLSENLKGASEEAESDWKIQVVTEEGGACTIKYEGSEEGGYEVTFDENGKINGGSWIVFSSLPSFSFNKAVETINVDCDFVSTPIISIIKVKNNAFYIIEERNSKVAEFNIKNGCYTANGASSGCNKEASFYASWVLSKLGKEISTNSYLEGEVSSDLDYAMLSDIDSSHLANLISRQSEEHFGNIYTTSFAVDAMGGSSYGDEKDSAISWVEEQQVDSGKIGSGAMDTAIALYLIYRDITYSGGSNDDESRSGGGNGCISDDQCSFGYTCNFETGIGKCELESSGCNNNNNCEISLGENALNCDDCVCGDAICDSSENVFSCEFDCTGSENQDCNNNGNCESYLGENEFNCPLDCPPDIEPQYICGNGICENDLGENNFLCSSDCEAEDEKGSLWWVWLIIIILILGGGGWFAFTKLKKGGSGKGSPSYLQSPRVPPPRAPQYRAPVRRVPRDRTVENELDKSIKQAQDLLKKK